jgi:hypothetical protein
MRNLDAGADISRLVRRRGVPPLVRIDNEAFIHEAHVVELRRQGGVGAQHLAK